jgi:uncharacterized membrane protein YeaQ/YmgE (transglycosylase-associated protein family)
MQVLDRAAQEDVSGGIIWQIIAGIGTAYVIGQIAEDFSSGFEEGFNSTFDPNSGGYRTN